MFDWVGPRSLSVLASLSKRYPRGKVMQTSATALRLVSLSTFVEDDITVQTAEAINRARTSLARGEGIPHEDLLQEFGLQPGPATLRAPLSGQSTRKAPTQLLHRVPRDPLSRTSDGKKPQPP